MGSILGATAILGGSSIVTILVGLVCAKVMAVLLGPNGFGFVGLLQNLVSMCGLVVGMGIGAGLVRSGASALAHENHVRVASLRKAAWRLFAILGSSAVFLLVVFRESVSHWMLGGPEHDRSVVFMGLALLFTVAASLQSSTLNAYHRVGALAKLSVIDSVLGGSISIAAVWVFGMQGVVPMIIAGAAASWAISRFFLWGEVKPVPADPPNRDVLEGAWSLLRFGAVYTVSLLVGTGVQLALPVVVLHTLGTESVGYYRAAVSISVRYLSFLIAAMAQDYYPRVSAAADKPAVLVRLVNEQHRLVMLLAVPIILGALAVVPYFVPLIYSPEFHPAVEVLEWQLIGDLFKLSSWTMSYVILARCGSLIFFLTELVFGSMSLLTAWLGIRWFGLPGLGISFLVTYLVYYLLVWLIARQAIRLIWTLDNKKMLLAAVGCALVVRLLPLTSLSDYRTAIALLFALLTGAMSLYAIWSEMGKVRNAKVDPEAA